MIALAGGLGAAIAWACSNVCSSRSSRLLGAPAALAWVMVIGLVPTLPVLALATRGPSMIDVGWLLVGGLGNIAGLLLGYQAVRIGYVGVVVPIISADGAIAAAIGLAVGEPITAVTAAALVLVTIGILVTAAAPATSDGDTPGDPRRPAALAIAAVLSLGVSLYALARIGHDLPLGWALLPPRAVGTVALAAPLAARSRLPRPGRALPFVVAGALGEVGGLVAFTWGARHDVAVASVLSSLLGPISAGVGWLCLGERLGRAQQLGVAVILVGLVALGITSA